MLNVSEETRNAYIDFGTNKELEIVITTSEIDPETSEPIVITLTNADIVSQSLSLKEVLESSENLTFTGCNASVLKFSCIDLPDYVVGSKVEVTITAIDPTTETPTEPITIFTGYIEDATNHSHEQVTMTVTAYDELYRISNVDYRVWYDALTFPISVLNFRNSFFSRAGITQVSTSLPNDSMLIHDMIEDNSLTGVTILRYICQINGRYGKINRYGQFEYVKLLAGTEGLYPSLTLYPSPTLYPMEDGIRYRVTTSYYEPGNIDFENYEVAGIDRVNIFNKEEEIVGQAGESTALNAFNITGNPLVYGIATADLNVVAANIYAEIKDLIFTPLHSINLIGLPFMDCGDFIAVVAKKSTIHTYILERTLSGGVALRDNYIGNSEMYQPILKPNLESKLQQAIEDAKEAAREEITDYDVAVQVMNNLAVNSMGAYQEYEEVASGGRTYYLSNMPIVKRQDGTCVFEQNSTVFKSDGHGLFVSTDGGLTWTNGYNPSTGQLVINVLNAIGISADWVKTGSLESQNYSYTSGYYADEGTKLYMNDGTIRSKYFALLAAGAYIKGHIEANSGSIGAWTIDNQRIYANVGTGAAELNPTKFGIAAINQRNALATLKTNLPYSYAFLDYGGESTEGGNTFGGFYVASQGNNLYVDPSLTHCRMSATQFTAYAASNRYSIISTTGFQFEQTAVGARFYSNFTNNDSEIVLEGSISSRLICYGPGVNWSYSNAGSGQYSDVRLKEDIHDISVELARDFFKYIRPVEFKYKADAQHKQQYGLIAQELEDALEEANIVNDMIVVEDASEDHYKQIYSNHYEAFSLKAIQDLYETVDKQQAEIDALKAEIEELKSLIKKGE